jgi:hypothetical protein
MHLRGADPALGSPLECQVPESRPPPPRGRERLSWGLVPYGTFQLEGSGSPGTSTSRHLPPSGFGHPLDGLLSFGPGDGPSTATAPMGFALQGLAPPGRRCPSQGLASPVVSPPTPKRGRPRLQRLTPTGKGNEDLRPKAAVAEPCPPGCSPLQGVLLRHLEAGFPARAPLALPAGSAPYGPLPGGASGDCVRRKRLVSLETAGPPGVLHLPERARI